MKRFVFGLATCAIALASCSTNDVLEQGSGSNNPNVINFSATTTRATVNNLDDVKKGFPVYAVNTNAKEWHINGQTYKFEGNTWKWIIGGAFNTAPQWPVLNTFPMNFYAYYPATKKDGSDAVYAPAPTKTGDDVNTLEAVITIGSTAAGQEDYLAANSTGITRPMATVPLAFKHITTKINFGVKAAAGTKSYIQQLNINNVKNTGTYDYVTNNNWSDQSGNAPYDYWETATANTEHAKEIKDFSCATNGTEVAAPFYNAESTPTAAAAHLMLLPQSETPVWEPVKTSDVASITPDKAYIGSVYRMTDGVDGNEKDLVGFAKAEDHPNYVGSVAQKNQYTGALFVKVGFPLATESDPKFSWIRGKAYTNNIALGQLDSSGGYILDNRYYDDKGNPTDLTIDGKNPGDPVLKGEIHFHVTVGDWEDANPQPDPIN
ncbi:MAG: fimbrillin family protein [Tannerellaceae bacterium]